MILSKNRVFCRSAFLPGSQLFHVDWNGSSLQSETRPKTDLLRPAAACIQPYRPVVETENISMYYFEYPESDGADLVPWEGTGLRVFDGNDKIHQVEVWNRTADTYMIPSGCILLGGAQNRTVKQNHIIAPGEQSSIYVYCVEQGRWSGGSRFRGAAVLPSIMRFHIDAMLLDGDTWNRRQTNIWQIIVELLLFTNKVNTSLALNGVYGREGEETVLSGIKERLDIVPKGANSSDSDAQKMIGSVIVDKRYGVCQIVLYPNMSFFGMWKENLACEYLWRENLARSRYRTHEFFRIFDEKSKLAIRCTYDGKPWKDMHGRYIMFYYRDEDLEKSFDPLMEEPPEMPTENGTLLPSAKLDVSIEMIQDLLSQMRLAPSADDRRTRYRTHFAYHPEIPAVGQIVSNEGRCMAMNINMLLN